MPVTTHCPEFEYDHIPRHSDTLAARTAAALIRMRSLTPEQQIKIGKDGRPVHKQYFNGLTPVKCGYYAGHYRGEEFICLKDYLVTIKNDSLVGHPPYRVPTDMQVLGNDIEAAIADVDFVWGVNSKVINRDEKVYRAVQVGVALFVYFLQIHPYANGNGHLARFFLITFLSRYKIYLKRWPMHPRPQDPPYSELIHRYRRGDRTSLERFVVACI